MVRLFGREWDRASLAARVGDARQLGGALPVQLEDGPERGVRAIEVRTGTGFSFWALPDRGLDVWRAEHEGVSLCWHSPTGPVAPAFYEAAGPGWLRGFYGGMLVTCGLSHAGPPHREGALERGLHGRASYLPARGVAIEQGWKGDEYPIEIRGELREAALFGEDLRLLRRIRTALGRSGFTLEDEVTNAGSAPAPLMLLYHVNAGFPALAEASELLAASAERRPADAEAEKDRDDWGRFAPPAPDFRERCTFHRLRAGPDGRAVVALVNRAFRGGRGFGYALRYPAAALPCLTEWKLLAAGSYVLGTEPGTVFPEPRERLLREGRLPTIQPGESRRFELEFEVLASPEEIRRVEREIQET